MSELALHELLGTAAGLLLRPPSVEAIEALAACGAEPMAIETARQDFYDVLCVAQSGRYIPPYAHVIARGKAEDDGWWHFPAPRYDGGDALAPWYRALGFDPLDLDIDPMLRGPHRPLDHPGFMLAFLAGAIASREQAAEQSIADAAIGNFIADYLGEWIERFCKLLAGSGSAYLQGVAGAVREAIEYARECFPAVPEVTAGKSPIAVERSKSGTDEARA